MTQLTDTRMTIFRVLPILGAVCLTVALAVPVVASPPGENEAPGMTSAKGAEPSVVADEEVRPVVDPETGEIVAEQPRQKTDALSAPLANALRRSTEGLHVFELDEGGRGIHLDGRFQHALMVRVTADGSLETVCVNHSHEAEAFLKRTSAKAEPQPQDK